MTALPDINNKQIEENGFENENIEALSIVSTNIADHDLQKPKSKKMNANRRKKQKQKQKQIEARIALEEIIKNMYCLKTTYAEEYEIINSLLEVDLNEDRFYEHINKIIRDEVDDLGQEIHERTASISELYLQEKTVNQKQIIELYERIQIVKQASIQVQKIINLFVLKVEEVEDEEFLHHNLDFSTLKYIIESDPCKEDFQNFCIAFTQQSTDKRLKNAIEGIYNTFKVALEHVDYNETQQTDDLQCYEQADIQQSKKKKKKKRQQKKQEERKKQMSLYKEISEANLVISSLCKMVIKVEQRQFCYVDQEWLNKINEKWKSMA